MKIGLQTWGSEGDIRPFIALAVGLADAGHAVTLVVTGMEHPEHRTLCERAGVTLRHAASIGPEIMAEMERRVDAIVYRRALPIDQLTTIMDIAFTPCTGQMEQAARALCEENDLVVGHFICFHLSTLAEITGTPHVTVAMSPDMVGSGHAPPSVLPHMGRTVNRLIWGWIDRLITKRLSPFIDPFRAAEGLPPIRSAMAQAWRSSLLTLIGVSPLFYPRRPDWPERVHATGFLFLPEAALPWRPEPELARFLDDGPPPVLFTFGSMLPHGEALRRETWCLMRDAARIAGCRALIHTGPETAPEGLNLPDNMMTVARVPFDRLMPHCAAVVHHGGSGTTQTATRAGRPQVVVEHIADQIAWGTILKRLGIAPPPLHRRNVTARKLAKAVGKVLGTPAMVEAARRAGEQLASEDGVAEAVRLIETTGLPATQAGKPGGPPSTLSSRMESRSANVP